MREIDNKQAYRVMSNVSREKEQSGMSQRGCSEVTLELSRGQSESEPHGCVRAECSRQRPQDRRYLATRREVRGQ